ncbi:MAG TPA: DUF1579 family protein [Azospirillaceae bacterium]|nr:DUF1579 family protein [Azospirillaceae bacterium]
MRLRNALAATLLAAAALLPLPAAAQVLPATAPELKVIAREAGIWDADITFPSRAPAKPDGKAKGVQVNELRSNGMWITNDFRIEGMPYQGMGVWGYDPKQGKYIGTWVDNNEHRIRQDVGTWDESTRTMTWTAEMIQADGQRIPLRFTEAYETDERRVFHMDGVHPKTGALVPLVHMVFTRRPGTAPKS